MKRFCLGLVFILFTSASIQAKDNFAEMRIIGSQVRNIQSAIVKQEYQLLIKTPADYGQSGKTYPVIYFLDAQWDFPLMVSTYGQSYYDGFIPEAILVGIQWGGDDPNPNVLRARDFTPTHTPALSNSGGAGAFLQFIKQELIPFISKEYQTNENRVLMGSSYGGLFTLYALFNEPNLFNGYVPTSSASGWDKNKLYEYAKGFANKKRTHPIRLYSAIGEFDDLMPAFDDLSAFFAKQQFTNVFFKFEKFAGLGHASLKGAGNTHGLHYIFAKPKLNLSKQELTKFVGKYRSELSGKPLEVLLVKGQLAVNMAGKTHTLIASSAHDFYQEGMFFKVNFTVTTNPQQMTINEFAEHQRFLRVSQQKQIH
jgi:predicted alpha/beta superfamily hydrolase